MSVLYLGELIAIRNSCISQLEGIEGLEKDVFPLCYIHAKKL